MIVVLPWPDKRLSPNARIYYRRLAEVKKLARDEAGKEVLAQLPLQLRQSVSQGDELIPLTITFFPPDRRLRDDDNMVASFKAYRDGIADALHVDDRRFRPHYVFADPEKPGRVEVRIGT